jgi:hypothetical protein
MKLTTCEMVREYLLLAGWDAEQRTQAAQALRHAETCGECRAALVDFDRIRDSLSAGEMDQPAGGWEAMHERLDDLLESRVSKARSKANPPIIRPSFAIAASIAVIAAATFQFGQTLGRGIGIREAKTTEVVINGSRNSDPAPATITSTELSHDVEAFQKVTDVYDGRAGWMMVSKDDSDVGIAPAPVTPGKKVLLLRLDLWHGRDLVSDSDLLVLAGQTADLTVPLENDQSLHYRVSTAGEPAAEVEAPEHLNLMLELKTPSGHRPLAALSTTLQLQPGQKVTAGRLTTSAGEYELKIEFKEADLAEKSQ